MNHFYDFRVWCEHAVSGIRYNPDRRMVYDELMNHLYDHYDDLVSQGMDSKSAQKAALAAMGNARQIAPQLAAIHRPFWGYLLSFTRISLVLSLCVVVFCGWFWNRYVYDYAQPFGHTDLNPYEMTQYDSMYIHQTRQYYMQPNLSQQSDGYTFTLTDAALWHVEHTNVEEDARDHDCVHFQIESFHPLPWAEYSEAMEWVWGVDSLGNVYDSFHKGIINYAPYIWVSSCHTGLLTYTYTMEITDYRSQTAEWIEFHYDRSGRNLVWRIQLPGGDAA